MYTHKNMEMNDDRSSEELLDRRVEDHDFDLDFCISFYSPLELVNLHTFYDINYFDLYFYNILKKIVYDFDSVGKIFKQTKFVVHPKSHTKIDKKRQIIFYIDQRSLKIKTINLSLRGVFDETLKAECPLFFDAVKLTQETSLLTKNQLRNYLRNNKINFEISNYSSKTKFIKKYLHWCYFRLLSKYDDYKSKFPLNKNSD